MWVLLPTLLKCTCEKSEFTLLISIQALRMAAWHYMAIIIWQLHSHFKVHNSHLSAADLDSFTNFKFDVNIHVTINPLAFPFSVFQLF
jgi:hypothetical protein